MSDRSVTDKQVLLDEIIKESKHRPVVPFIGSGISVSAGYPTIRLVIQYLAKVDFAIRFGVFQDRFPLVKGGKEAQEALVEHYSRHPSKYIEDFGWPDLGQLDADLWEWLGRKRFKGYEIPNEIVESEDYGVLGEGRYRIWITCLMRHIKCQKYLSAVFDLINNFMKIIEYGETVNTNHAIFDKISKSKKNYYKHSTNDKEDKITNELINSIAEALNSILDNKDKKNIEFAIHKVFKILEETNKNPSDEVIDVLSNDITKRPIGNTETYQLEFRDHLDAIVQWTLRQELAQREYGTRHATLKEWLQWKRWYHHADTNVKVESDSKDFRPNLLFGDWEMLLDKLCEGNFDLADTLFNEFEKGLSPALSHRLLAFLQPKLGMPLLLTTNFDSLLECAFSGEGLKPKVFDVHRDVQLPTPDLVHQQLSILKLHGSAFGLRFGERLKHKLETDTRNNALQYLPKNALVLVLGFSGSERRMMQMLQAFAESEGSKSCRPRLIWIQGPGDPGPLFDELMSGSPERVKWCRVRHADTFLQELYFKIANSHQSSFKSYSSLPGQLRMTELTLELKNNKPNIESILKRRPVQFFVAKNAFVAIKKADEIKVPSGSWATLAAVAFTHSLDTSYSVIWIDLENHQTVEGIIAEFFKRVQIIDPQAPSCNITGFGDDPTEEIKKAIIRIREVLQRGRFVLVLDSLESFGRPQMVHHGTPTYIYGDIKLERTNSVGNNLKDEFENQIHNLYKFLKSLLYLDSQAAKKYVLEFIYCCHN